MFTLTRWFSAKGLRGVYSFVTVIFIFATHQAATNLLYLNIPEGDHYKSFLFFRIEFTTLAIVAAPWIWYIFYNNEEKLWLNFILVPIVLFSLVYIIWSGFLIPEYLDCENMPHCVGAFNATTMEPIPGSGTSPYFVAYATLNIICAVFLAIGLFILLQVNAYFTKRRSDEKIMDPFGRDKNPYPFPESDITDGSTGRSDFGLSPAITRPRITFVSGNAEEAFNLATSVIGNEHTDVVAYQHALQPMTRLIHRQRHCPSATTDNFVNVHMPTRHINDRGKIQHDNGNVRVERLSPHKLFKIFDQLDKAGHENIVNECLSDYCLKDNSIPEHHFEHHPFLTLSRWLNHKLNS